MNVPNSWWAGITSLELNAGAISHLDFNQENESYFKLVLDKEKGIYYAMRHDAVFLYADESHPMFTHFHLVRMFHCFIEGIQPYKCKGEGAPMDW
jgi:hypothetical protein